MLGDYISSELSTRGQTRTSSTTTEAESYMRLALAANVFRPAAESSARATTENHALDSYQNLLFSIARYKEFTGNEYPEKITVVGYEMKVWNQTFHAMMLNLSGRMKRARFTELHRAAIRWPIQQFEYIGVDPDGEDALSGNEGEVSCSVPQKFRIS